MSDKNLTIEAKVLLSSGTSQNTIAYTIENVTEWYTDSNGFYKIKTKDKTYCFPISRTILIMVYDY